MTNAVQEHAAPLLKDIAAARICGLRNERHWNQTELGVRVGLSRAKVTDRESGRTPVGLDELPFFAAALGTSVAYLMGLTDDRSRPLEEAASELVRHVGLEPTTRWFEGNSTVGLTRLLTAIDQLDQAHESDDFEADAPVAATTKGQCVVELATFESKRERRWAEATFRHQVTRVFSRRKPA